MTVSIIIAVKSWQENLAQCLKVCRELDFQDFEILILPDEPIQGGLSPKGTVPLQFIPTGPVSPAKKRDIALQYAKGQILAFLDDDTYPQADWLKKALENFSDTEIAAVGGPSVTPGDDSLRQKGSGLVYSSYLVSGKFAYRYIPAQRREVEDYPSCNFLVRKSVMQELGGFKTNYWPGEDTKLCLEITYRLKKKIIYDPQVLIYHHRRPLFMPHLRQVLSYALHRGYFAKRYPETSLKIYYLAPSIFVLAWLFGGVLGLCSSQARSAYLIGISLYLTAVFFNTLFIICAQQGNLVNRVKLIFLVWPGIVLTHIAYGVYFLKGLLAVKLKEEE